MYKLQINIHCCTAFHCLVFFIRMQATPVKKTILLIQHIPTGLHKIFNFL